VPRLLAKEFPQELENPSDGDVKMRVTPTGKKRVFIVIDRDLDKTLELIYSLPPEYFQF
jgi:hypothetical protein